MTEEEEEETKKKEDKKEGGCVLEIIINDCHELHTVSILRSLSVQLFVSFLSVPDYYR